MLYEHKSPLSSETRLGVKEGLEAVAVWRERGGLPHSVESTACLMQIHDTERRAASADGAQAQRSEMELRMAYSLAVIRAVNGLVDPGQKGLYADSVMSIAAARGIPSWIVELRHDGTHNQLPAYSTLRTACDYLVEWFYDNYWEVQSQHVQAYFNITPSSSSSDGTEESSSSSSRVGAMITPSSSSSSTGMEKAVLETLAEACPTSITGVFVPEILLGGHGNGGSRPDVHYYKFDERTFEHMSRIQRGTALLDTIIARLVKCTLDKHDELSALVSTSTSAAAAAAAAAGEDHDSSSGSDAIELPGAHDHIQHHHHHEAVEGCVLCIVTCHDLLQKAAGPWRNMHQHHQHPGGNYNPQHPPPGGDENSRTADASASAAAGDNNDHNGDNGHTHTAQQAVYEERRTAARLLHLYWLSLLGRGQAAVAAAAAAAAAAAGSSRLSSSQKNSQSMVGSVGPTLGATVALFEELTSLLGRYHNHHQEEQEQEQEEEEEEEEEGSGQRKRKRKRKRKLQQAAGTGGGGSSSSSSRRRRRRCPEGWTLHYPHPDAERAAAAAWPLGAAYGS
jgi:hypothetical protein